MTYHQKRTGHDAFGRNSKPTQPEETDHGDRGNTSGKNGVELTLSLASHDVIEVFFDGVATGRSLEFVKSNARIARLPGSVFADRLARMLSAEEGGTSLGFVDHLSKLRRKAA